MKPRTFTVTVVTIAIGAAAAALHSAFGAREPTRMVHIGRAVAERAAGAGVAAGPADAAVVVRVFSDFQCPACRRLDAEAGTLLRRWAADGLLRYVHIHAPLRAHRRGPAAAAASHCAARTGKAWDMHRLLTAQLAEWTHGGPPEPRFIAYAHALGIDTAAFARCLADPATADQVQRDRAAARSLAPDRVPVVYVNDVLIDGVRHPDQLVAHVRRLLRLPEAGSMARPHDPG